MFGQLRDIGLQKGTLCLGERLGQPSQERDLLFQQGRRRESRIHIKPNRRSDEEASSHPRLRRPAPVGHAQAGGAGCDLSPAATLLPASAALPLWVAVGLSKPLASDCLTGP